MPKIIKAEYCSECPWQDKQKITIRENVFFGAFCGNPKRKRPLMLTDDESTFENCPLDDE